MYKSVWAQVIPLATSPNHRNHLGVYPHPNKLMDIFIFAVSSLNHSMVTNGIGKTLSIIRYGKQGVIFFCLMLLVIPFGKLDTNEVDSSR